MLEDPKAYRLSQRRIEDMNLWSVHPDAHLNCVAMLLALLTSKLACDISVILTSQRLFSTTFSLLTFIPKAPRGAQHVLGLDILCLILLILSWAIHAPSIDLLDSHPRFPSTCALPRARANMPVPFLGRLNMYAS